MGNGKLFEAGHDHFSSCMGNALMRGDWKPRDCSGSHNSDPRHGEEVIE